MGRALDGSRRLSGPAPAAVATLVALSIISGLVEAALVAVLAQAATILAGGTVAPISVGGVSLDAQSLSSSLRVAAALAVARLIAQVLSARLPATIAADIHRSFRSTLVHAYLHADWREKASLLESELQEVLTTHVNLAGQRVLARAALMSAAINLVILLVVALAIDSRAAAAVCGAALVLFALFRPLSTVSRGLANRYSSAHQDLASRMTEAARVSAEISTFGVADEFARSIDDRLDRVRATFIPTMFVGGVLPAAYQGIAVLGLLSSLALLANFGSTNLAGLGAVLLLCMRCFSYSQQVQASHQQMNSSLPFEQSVRSLTERLERHQETQREGVATPTHFDVAVEKVSYSYGDTSALRDVTLRVNHGRLVAIVGPSGAGKSTLAELLVGLREPSKGRITVAGVPRSSIDRRAWANRVAFVPQNPKLIAGSVADNIRFRRPDISSSDVADAAMAAHIATEIEALPNGFETVLGGSSSLSGGQIQRLCIARALAARPSLLVLDEPTSGLDRYSKDRIVETLKALSTRCLVFVVSHDNSLSRECDLVVVVDDGSVVATGSPTWVAMNNSFYSAQHS